MGKLDVNPQFLSHRTLTEAELRAKRTLAAAEQLLYPERLSDEARMSAVEAELQRYVKEAYPRHSLSQSSGVLLQDYGRAQAALAQPAA
ncbi:hypothetical protein [Achromobacter sp. Marseille-Q4962]|uniref:hypothetical protein n=1 Tax=Achromobacter sp. Marseille-Q4962 TaxID=2942202 RepID=UPI0020748C62|nr:hypothetical protein [Achromobacter sp. Marseille-Q4962]